MPTPPMTNAERIERWGRAYLRAEGLAYSLRGHLAQRVRGVDWDHRGPCRAHDEPQIYTGRLRLDTGYLPLRSKDDEKRTRETRAERAGGITLTLARDGSREHAAGRD